MLGGNGNGVRHEGLGISFDTIRVKSRVGALETGRFKRIKLNGVLNQTYLEQYTDDEEK